MDRLTEYARQTRSGVIESQLVKVKKTDNLNLVPRVSHLTAPWGERGEALVWSGHVCPRIWDITIKLLKGGAP